MKIFWSWQADTPGRVGRHFIRASLLEAIASLKQQPDVEEPSAREVREGLHLDQDRQGVTGSPDLVRTILDKIDHSEVVIADITPVSTIPSIDGERDEKRNMNPNVAIELGYALKALGEQKLLMVLNAHYGGRGFIPFDLAQKGGPIIFKLSPDADKQKILAEKKELTGKFVSALRPYIDAASSSRQPSSAFTRQETTFSPAYYSKLNEVLAEYGEDDDRTEYLFEPGRAIYLRLIPNVNPQRRFSKGVLMHEVELGKLYAFWRERPRGFVYANEYGAIVFEPKSNASQFLKASTQVFPSGEIWGIANWLHKIDGQYIPSGAFEQTYKQNLRRYVDFMSVSLGLPPPYTVVAGASGLKGFTITTDSARLESFGPFYDDEYLLELVLNSTDQTALDAVLLNIFEEFFRLTGYERPPGLNGFPRSQ